LGICLERGAYGPADATATRIISCFIKIKIHIGLNFLMLAYPGCLGKEAVKSGVYLSVHLYIVKSVWHKRTLVALKTMSFMSLFILFILQIVG